MWLTKDPDDHHRKFVRKRYYRTFMLLFCLKIGGAFDFADMSKTPHLRLFSAKLCCNVFLFPRQKCFGLHCFISRFNWFNIYSQVFKFIWFHLEQNGNTCCSQLLLFKHIKIHLRGFKGFGGCCHVLFQTLAVFRVSVQRVSFR